MIHDFFALRCLKCFEAEEGIGQEKDDNEFTVKGWVFGGIFIAPLIAFFLMKLDKLNMILIFIVMTLLLIMLLQLFHTKSDAKEFDQREIYVLLPLVSIVYWTLLLSSSEEIIEKVFIYIVLIILLFLIGWLWSFGFYILKKFFGDCNHLIWGLGVYYVFMGLIVPLVYFYFLDEKVFVNLIKGIMIAFFHYFSIVVLFFYSTAFKDLHQE